MPEGILWGELASVNAIQLCKNSNPTESLSIDDLEESIRVLVRYIISRNMSRKKLQKDWETKTLAEACEVLTDGNWIESKDQSPEGIRLIQTGNIGEGVFKNRESKARYISEKTFKRLNCTEIFEGDCLISRLPEPVGRACLLPQLEGRAITAVDCSILRFKKDFYQKFFIYYSLSQKYLSEVERQCTGATRKRISRKNLGKVNVPYPSLSKQKRIVKILDEKFAGIDELKKITEEQIGDAKELFESRLSEIFKNPEENWEEKKLGEMGILARGKSKHRPRNDKSLYGGKYPFVQTGDVRNASFVLDTYSQTYSEKGLKQSKLWPKGTLCITIAANIAETAILGMDACFPDSVIGFIPENGNYHFYQYLLMFNKIELQKRGKGSAQDNINLGTFESMMFSIPPDKHQKQIVKELNSLWNETKELEAIFHRKITDLEELKKSYLQQAFTGKL